MLENLLWSPKIPMYMDPRDANCHIHIIWEWEFPIHSIYKEQQLYNQQPSLDETLLMLMLLFTLPPNDGMKPSKYEVSS